eukprot:104824-Amphidinium_carterae.1
MSLVLAALCSATSTTGVVSCQLRSIYKSMQCANMQLPSGLVTDDIKHHVHNLIQQGKLGQRVAMWEQIQDVLLKAGLARAQVSMPPELVGTHPEN